MSWPICETDIGGEDLLVTTATATGSAEDVMGSCNVDSCTAILCYLTSACG